MYYVRLMRQPYHPMWMVPPCRSALCHPTSILLYSMLLPLLLAPAAVSLAWLWHLASCPSGRHALPVSHTHLGTYTHTQKNRAPCSPVQRMCISRTMDLPVPLQPMMTRRGLPSSGPGPLCRRMASTECHPQISSASIESMENANTTGSEISPALISPTAVRKYVFEIYLLWKSMQRTL
jgi:hypothetical protein